MPFEGPGKQFQCYHQDFVLGPVDESDLGPGDGNGERDSTFDVDITAHSHAAPDLNAAAMPAAFNAHLPADLIFHPTGAGRDFELHASEIDSTNPEVQTDTEVEESITFNVQSDLRARSRQSNPDAATDAGLSIEGGDDSKHRGQVVAQL